MRHPAQAPPRMPTPLISNGNGFICPISHPARIAPPTHKSAQSRPIAHNRRKPPAPPPPPPPPRAPPHPRRKPPPPTPKPRRAKRPTPPPPPCFSPQI